MRKVTNEPLWIFGLALIVAIIAFSSSGLAARILDRGLCSTYTLATGRTTTGGSSLYSNIHFIVEKGTHLTMYTLLGFLLSGLYSNRRYGWAYTVATGFSIGIASELLQFFFPGRDPAVRDVLINFAGTVVGVLSFIVVSSRHLFRTTAELQPSN